MATLALCLACMPVVPVSAATRHEAGISTSGSLVGLPHDQLNQRLADIKELGAVWIRVDFSWPVIQPDNAQGYEWSPYDYLIQRADAHGLKILAVLAYTPGWAQDQQCAQVTQSAAKAQKCPPQTIDSFARFARAASMRYAGTNVRAWEIWNEPNSTVYLRTPQQGSVLAVNPRKYAQLANAAALEIRNHYKDSVIITGGLSPMFEPHPNRAMRQSDYLDQLLPHLRSDLYDAVGIHPYSWPVRPSKVADYNAFYTVDNGKSEYNLRTIMSKHGWGGKEIWATEYGASTKGLISTPRPSKALRPDHVSEPAQASLIGEGVKEWYKKQNVGPLFVHSDSDRWLKNNKNEHGFGLRRVDDTKKPAYFEFQDAAQGLRSGL